MTPLLSSGLLRGQTDDRLVELAAAGHDRAFEAIVERYRRPLLRYLRRLLSDTLAEDVVQATFINAWSSLRTGTEVRELRPWLYRIAHNAAINSLKKVGEAMEEVPESAGGFATEPAAELERREEVHRALTHIAALPSRQRAALLAVAVDGRAHSDVAQELGLTDGAVRQLVHRARTTLRMGVTALTPMPLLHALMVSAGDSTVARVAEVAAGAGGAGAASVSLKAGAAAVLATGALVTGGPQMADVIRPAHKPSARPAQAAAPAASPSTSASTPVPAKPAALVTPPLASTTPSTSGGASLSSPGSSGRSHRQRRRGRDADKSGSSSGHQSTGGHGGGSGRRESSGSGSGESSSGSSRGSSGSGHGGEGDGTGNGEGETRTASGSGDGGGGESGGGESSGGESGGGGEGSSGTPSTSASRGSGEAHATSGAKRHGARTKSAKKHGGGHNSGKDDVLVTPPAKTPAPDDDDSGGGGQSGSTPAPPQTIAPPAAPTTPSGSTGEVRTAPSGGEG